MNTESFRFIVIADSHIRFPDDETDLYPSNALMVGRNQSVVEMCNAIDAEFVVHLGDIVHPIPAQTGHQDAVRLAEEIYAQLDKPIYFVPGNHDIGDKPEALVAVPTVEESFYGVFNRHWGPAFQSFDAGSLHFVLVDTPVLGSGLDRETAQRDWLEADMEAASAAGRRIFMFTHYPPFLRQASENEHYDNLGPRPRSWLLGLIERHAVEAVFSGHVHNLFYNHHAGTEMYVLPSTGFVRPDYSEFAAVVPDEEYGRDDRAKLGFFVVDVRSEGHVITPIRTFGTTPDDNGPRLLEAALDSTWRSPIGVTLRHGWRSAVDMPTAGLDEFNRKSVRNDAMLFALWEGRIADVRVPLADVTSTSGTERLRHLNGRGFRFTVRTAGVPEAATLGAVAGLGGLIARWEVVVPRDRFTAAVAAVAAAGLDPDLELAASPLVPLSDGGGHFVASGFGTGGELIADWLQADPDDVFNTFVFRALHDEPAGEAVASAYELARGAGRRAVVTVELPRATESAIFSDDSVVASRVAEAVDAAHRFDDVTIFLDSFMDHDRGYYPRHGLIDRRHNPRPALYELIAEARRARAGLS
jgi:3',5'-cyclic AMP phosphodiesterase CpdA